MVDAVADAMREDAKLVIVGGGTKAAVGRAVPARELVTTGLSGIVDYDPAELVITVKPGTPLAEVVGILAEQEQVFAFDPFDTGPLWGQPAGASTIGGTVAAGLSGSGRVSGGAVRDHLLGFRAVSGRAEAFAAGGKVVKNVTGFDLCKLAVRSWGRLFVLTELSLKVVPAPRRSVTFCLPGADDATAFQAMSRAMGSQAEVAAAAHFPARSHGGESATIFRLQGFGPSVAARSEMLKVILAELGALHAISEAEALSLWESLRTLAPLPASSPLWRVCLAASLAAGFLEPFQDDGSEWLLDWAGGLVWLASDADPVVIRGAAEAAGGHAMLVRGGASLKSSTAIFQSRSPGVEALEQRLRRAFDPAGIFEAGRF